MAEESSVENTTASGPERVSDESEPKKKKRKIDKEDVSQETDDSERLKTDESESEEKRNRKKGKGRKAHLKEDVHREAQILSLQVMSKWVYFFLRKFSTNCTCNECVFSIAFPEKIGRNCATSI